jgi:hypothetical protein
MKNRLIPFTMVIVFAFTLASCASRTTLAVDAPPTQPSTTLSCYELSLTDLPGCALSDGLPPIDPNSIEDLPDDLPPAIEDTSFTVRGDETIYDGPNVLDPTTSTSTSLPLPTTSTTTSTSTITSTSTTTTTSTVPTTSTSASTTVAPCSFTGFFSPVDNAPVVNVVKAGAAVPVKFGFCQSGSLQIFASGAPSSSPHICGTAATAEIESTVTVSTSGLTFDATSGRYQYNWKTDKGWAGQCRTLTLNFSNGTNKTAEFKFR